jgi:hypothetical protein
MTLPGWLQRVWLGRCSRPAGERPIWRHVLACPPRRVLEVGLGTLGRTERLLKLLRTIDPSTPVQFVGIDRFESRTPADRPGVSLQEAHRRLTGLARVQLVPGNADGALARVGNHVGVFDLVLVSADEPPEQMERTWFFLQRLVRPDSTMLVEPGPGATWGVLAPPRLAELASRPLRRRAA